MTRAGQVAAALVYVRGEKTHAHVAFGATSPFGDGGFGGGPFGGGWRWQAHQPTAQSRAKTTEDRILWYDTLVADHGVLGPLRECGEWLRDVLAGD